MQKSMGTLSHTKNWMAMSFPHVPVPLHPGHVASTICRDNWLGFKSLWLGFRIRAYGQGVGSILKLRRSVFRLELRKLLADCQRWNHDNHHSCMGLGCYRCCVQLSRTCVPNLSCDYFNQLCSADGKIDKAQKCMLCTIIHFQIVFRYG